jgi:hypothetical protein
VQRNLSLGPPPVSYGTIIATQRLLAALGVQIIRDTGPMASNHSYPRLHVEIFRLSDAAILVDGWLIEAKGRRLAVLNYCGSMDEVREKISNCASKHGAHCGDQDIVIHEQRAHEKAR